MSGHNSKGVLGDKRSRLVRCGRGVCGCPASGGDEGAGEHPIQEVLIGLRVGPEVNFGEPVPVLPARHDPRAGGVGQPSARCAPDLRRDVELDRLAGGNANDGTVCHEIPQKVQSEIALRGVYHNYKFCQLFGKS